MAHFFRVVLWCLAFVYSNGSLALEVKKDYPANNCSAANYPHVYREDASVSGNWACGISGNERSCGWILTSPRYGWDGTLQNGLILGMCNLPEPVYSCTDGANLSVNAHGEKICTCASGLREVNGQCTALASCADGMHDEGGTCVPDKCSKNEIRVNGVCVPDPDDDCPDGKKKVNGKCEKACPAHGTMAGEFKVGSTNYTSFCENKCTVVIDSFLQLIKDGKVVEYIGIGKYTGGSCNGPAYTPPDVDPKNPDPPTPPDPDKPDPEKPDPNNPGNPGGGNTGGSNPGGGNSGSSNPGSGNTGGGKPGNVNPGGGNPGSNSPPEKCPNGNCTGTGGGTPAGGSSSGVDGSCPDGTYKAGGQCYPKSPPAVDPDNDGKCPVGHKKVGGSCVAYQPTPDSETEGKDGFCKDNPSSIICKQSTFQGACESGFTCEGDAMLCAIARDQHSRNCKLFDTKNAESDLYNQEKDKKGSQIKDLEGNRQESLANRINTSDAFGSGQCIQDLAVVVAGKAVTLPFSKICPYLAIIGNIMIAISLLLAIRIVGRG